MPRMKSDVEFSVADTESTFQTVSLIKHVPNEKTAGFRYDVNNPILCIDSEFAEVGPDTEDWFDGSTLEVERRMLSVWKAQMDRKVDVERFDRFVERDGTQWVVVTCRAEMVGTQFRCAVMKHLARAKL